MNAVAFHKQVVDWLRSPAAYPNAPSDVQSIETHISVVFLAGDLVYKLKKPVKYDFLDFSALQSRELACREEVRLNRRLAPDIYLGVAPITRGRDGDLQLDGVGDIVDWLVVMRRIPHGRTLDALHRRGELSDSDIDRLTGVLWHFHKNAERTDVTSGEYRAGYVDRVRSDYQELMKNADRLPQRVIQRVHGFQLEVLHLRPSLLDARVQGRQIVEGHGDLRPEHICLSEPIVIFDCIEFNPALRQIDVADELAFLASECDFIGASWAGDRLLRNYRELSKDSPPTVLIDFYKAFRASVRAKVAVLRGAQLDEQARHAALAEALAHLHLADQYAAPHIRPLMLAVGGLSGTGKTTLARHIAGELAAELLRSDVIRQERFGRPDEGEASSVDRYSPESRQLVYQRLIKHAAELAHDRVSVIVDATFSTADDLLSLAAAAQPHDCAFLAIECTCRPEIARARIETRRRTANDESEADFQVYESQRAAWQSWPQSVSQMQLDTEQPLDQQFSQIKSFLSGLVSQDGGKLCG